MQVRITRQPTGLLNGAPWPARGDVVDLPEHVAASMATAGLVEYSVVSEDDTESAVPSADPAPETRPAQVAAVETREEAKPRGGHRGRSGRATGSG